MKYIKLKYTLLLSILILSSCEMLHWDLPERSDHDFISFETTVIDMDITECLGLVQDENGYTILGTSQESESDNADLILVQLDSLGKEAWNTTYGDSDSEYAAYLHKIQDNSGYMILGNKHYNRNDWQAYLVKTDPFGNKIWEQKYGWVNEDKGTSLIQLTNNGFLISGHSLTWESANLGSEAILFQTRADGSEQTRYNYGNSAENNKILNDFGNKVIEAEDGHYLLLITKEDAITVGKFNLHLLKLDKNNFSVIWERKLIENCYQMNSTVIPTINGYAILGALSNNKLSLVHTTVDGVKEWERSFNNSDCETSASLFQTSDSGYLICSSGMTVIRTDENGLEIARLDYPGINTGTSCIAETRDSGIILAGIFNNESSNNTELRIIKIHPDILFE